MNTDCTEKNMVENIMSDPSVSFWLKNAITELLKRDPVDALSDARVLHHLMGRRFKLIIEKQNKTLQKGEL